MVYVAKVKENNTMIDFIKKCRELKCKYYIATQHTEKCNINAEGEHIVLRIIGQIPKNCINFVELQKYKCWETLKN